MTLANDELHDVVTAEAALIARFVELLEAEQEALTKGNIEDLARLASEKEPLAADLQRLGQQRNDHLVALKLSADRQGMSAWTAGNPDASSTWEKTLELAARARDINRLNGELIQMRLNFNSQLLEILQRNRGALDLYGPDGKTSGPGERRIDDAV